VGPTTSKLHLVVQSDWSLKPVYDVIAVIKGSEAPDQWVVRGNHHDGWVFGAFDPLGGNVAMMNEAQAIGALVRGGWKPKRTIVYASWDGEEPGLIGSTEWAETHAAELQKNAVVYINSDTNGRGFLGVEGSHELERMVNQTAADVKDPEHPVTVRERQLAMLGVRAYSNPTDGAAQRAAKKADTGGDLPIGALGSGSDYSAFLQRTGTELSVQSVLEAVMEERNGAPLVLVLDEVTYFASERFEPYFSQPPDKGLMGRAMHQLAESLDAIARTPGVVVFCTGSSRTFAPKTADYDDEPGYGVCGTSATSLVTNSVCHVNPQACFTI